MLSLMQQAMSEMGLPSPSIVAGNSNQDVTQTLALMNAVGYELQREHPWQGIDKEYRFNAVTYNYTATVTSGSTTISVLSSTTGLTTTPPSFMVTGAGIPQDCYLVSVNAGASTAVLSQPAQASGTLVSLTFSQTMYAMPSDFDRIVDETQWDKSTHWKLLGPETAQQWQWLKSGYISTGPRIRYRQLGSRFQIWPPSGISDLLGFEYISNQWVTSAAALAAGTAPDKTALTVDTDTNVFPDRLVVLGTKLKYFAVKGFDTTNLMNDYETQKMIAKSADAGSPTLSMNPRPSQVLLGYGNIPDSAYGS